MRGKPYFCPTQTEPCNEDPTMFDFNYLLSMLEELIQAALRAGCEIMKIYNSPETDWQVERKADNSPLTLADRRSHDVIAEALAASPFPMLSEEGEIPPYEERSSWTRLWIVDPLDGTKEFLKRNGEFTVNIALVENGTPTLGIIYAPALYRLYWGVQGEGAFMAEVDPEDMGIRPEQRLPLHQERQTATCRVVASRSHLSPETEQFIHRLRQTHSHVETLSAGSSLKICLVAEGRADVYPRLAPTMEWDTAAGHAIALAAGCRITDAQTGLPLLYNKEDLHNPWFVVER